MNITPFVEDTFTVPNGAKTALFKLEPLTIHHVAKDYDAVMANRDYLWQRFGDVWGWPPTDLSPEQDLIDLAWHQKEFQMRSTFAYSVLSLDDSEVLGCVYVFPPRSARSKSANADAEVWFWATQSDSQPNLEQALGIFLADWLQNAWAFHSVLLNNITHVLGK